MDDFERSIMIDTMGEHYQEMESIVNKLIQVSIDLEEEVLKAEGTDDDDLEFEVLDFLNQLVTLEDEKDASMLSLGEKVKSMPKDMQEFDFKDDIEYRVFHDGLYKFIHEFILYATTIIEVCLFLDNETTVRWALENGYFDDEEGDE